MDNDFASKISSLQNQFYASSGGKNSIFKKQQKFECATTICENMGIDELIQKTFYRIPNTNKIYGDYTVFKLYANPTNFEYISFKLLELTNSVYSEYGDYEAHINLDSFTISACERYKSFITTYCDKCFGCRPSDTDDTKCNLSKMYIYNTPSVIDSISKILKPLLHPDVRNRIVYYNKKDSPGILLHLHTTEPR